MKKCKCKVPVVDLEDEDLTCQTCGGKVTDIPVSIDWEEDNNQNLDEDDEF